MQIRQSITLQRHLQAGSRHAQRAGVMALMPDISLISAMKDTRSYAGHILGTLLNGWEAEQVIARIEHDCSRRAASGQTTTRDEDPRKVIGIVIEGTENARIAREGKSDGIANTGHFLLWVLGNDNLTASHVLDVYGVTANKVAALLAKMPENEDVYINMAMLDKQMNDTKPLSAAMSEFPEEQYDGAPVRQRKRKAAEKSAIEKYATSLTKAARDGRIDPVVGRSNEIERLIQILGRRKKNNPVLIGEPGVGKSAIVEGLALRMASDGAPASLSGKEIYSLDVASLVAGTKFRGEFEQRIKELLNELTANRNIILFIDEIHTIVGAGGTQGSLDTANILKPTLARGELQCIGATTLDEYRENIEADGALERRFQKIVVEPSTRKETLEILNNVKDNYERHHSVRYTAEALRACVELTGRYVTDRHFPDKAIDALDEAGSRARLTGTEEIDVAQIEHVITSMTGIPVESVSQDEKARLGAMPEALAGRVIGQQTAVDKVVRSIRRSRAGLKNPDKPIGVFMFVGPTGVGKTHLTKELARWMFLRPDSLIRIDMSEYGEKHNVSRMIGSPPGYVGYNEGGQLTEAVRRQPYAVVLFDEIEKAHPDVFNLMLQIFDEGQLTDGNGRKVDFRNTVIIMTSNVGSHSLAQKAPAVGYGTRGKAETMKADTASHYRAALDATFAPEFINRIDDIVVFNTLSEGDVERIVDLELSELSARAAKLGYRLTASAAARKRLAALGYNERYGVRALKRTILEHVEEPLAQLIVNNGVEAGDAVKIDCHGSDIKLSRRAPKAAPTTVAA